jgi:hypothetical protein
MAAPHRRQGFPRWGWPALLALLVLVVTGCSGVPSNTPEAAQSRCDTMPVRTVPGLMRPGHRTIAGTR